MKLFLAVMIKIVNIKNRYCSHNFESDTGQLLFALHDTRRSQEHITKEFCKELKFIHSN